MFWPAQPERNVAIKITGKKYLIDLNIFMPMRSEVTERVKI